MTFKLLVRLNQIFISGCANSKIAIDIMYGWWIFYASIPAVCKLEHMISFSLWGKYNIAILFKGIRKGLANVD